MEKKKTRSSHVRADKPGFNLKFSYFYAAVFFLLTIAYLAESFIPSPDKKVLVHYHLTTTGYFHLVIPIVIITSLIWLISLYGSLRVKSYARLIRGSRDGGGMNMISNGLLVQTISFPLTSSLRFILNHIADNHPGFQPSSVIIVNYISLALLGLAFGLIFYGSFRLRALTSTKTKQIPLSIWQAVFIAASSLYSYFIVIEPIHHPIDRQVYSLPDWLLVTTIAIPYMYFWYLGVRAAYNVFLYRNNVNGLVYRSALSYLASGIAVVILSSVVTRVITSISSRITSLQITPILIIIYALLCIIAAGFVLIAVGAKKLRKIEEA